MFNPSVISDIVLKDAFDRLDKLEKIDTAYANIEINHMADNVRQLFKNAQQKASSNGLPEQYDKKEIDERIDKATKNALNIT